MSQRHPCWCSPSSCTAYSTELTEYRCHRSEPVVLPTSDHHIKIYLYRSAENADVDHIELIELEAPITSPWYLNEPRTKPIAELALPLNVARLMGSAIVTLIDPDMRRSGRRSVRRFDAVRTRGAGDHEPPPR